MYVPMWWNEWWTDGGIDGCTHRITADQFMVGWKDLHIYSRFIYGGTRWIHACGCTVLIPNVLLSAKLKTIQHRNWDVAYAMPLLPLMQCHCSGSVCRCLFTSKRYRYNLLSDTCRYQFPFVPLGVPKPDTHWLFTRHKHDLINNMPRRKEKVQYCILSATIQLEILPIVTLIFSWIKMLPRISV